MKNAKRFQFKSGTGNDRIRGVALITTVLLLAMLALLVIGFVQVMSLERRAAHSVEHAQRTKLIAQGAVSHAVDLLRTNIPEPAAIDEYEGMYRLKREETKRLGRRADAIQPSYGIVRDGRFEAKLAPAENWAINPGRLTVIEKNGSYRTVDLHTGADTDGLDVDGVRDATSVDLNEPLPGESVPSIAVATYPDGTPDSSAARPLMRVKWVPVLSDPSQSAGKENPMIGRYAFWMDDECAKLNFNSAFGKPSRDQGDETYWEEYDKGHQPPRFPLGDGATERGGKPSRWALGKPQSVNFDVLFQSPEDYDRDAIHDHVMLRGYQRYPEAVQQYATGRAGTWNTAKQQNWYGNNRFNITFYNRAPEFNVFGKSRMFTTFIPLSLEAGPMYQLPFVYDPDGFKSRSLDDLSNDILHLSTLMGRIGFHRGTDDNKLMRRQLGLLYRYLSRPFPGYSKSFVDKYGQKGAMQIALNILMYGRLATTNLNSNDNGFSNSYGFRSTSVNYNPDGRESKDWFPESMYWRFKFDGDSRETPLLPQTPGPHVTEVRMVFEPVPEPGNAGQFRVKYRLESEYYMHPFGPKVIGGDFPTRVDYLKFDFSGDEVGEPRVVELGPNNPLDTEPKRLALRHWGKGDMNRLVVKPKNLGPVGSNGRLTNRALAKSRDQFFYTDPFRVKSGSERTFAAGTKVRVRVKLRCGIGFEGGNGENAAKRPRQMIPLGEYEDDTLEGIVELDFGTGKTKALSWQILDPLLSGDKDQWKLEADTSETAGTPGQPNKVPVTSNSSETEYVSEPDEDSSEKSVFRFTQRSPRGHKVDGLVLDRADEYSPGSRVASKGYFTYIHTGMHKDGVWERMNNEEAERQRVFRTLNLGARDEIPGMPPDYLLLNLMGATYPMAHSQWRAEGSLPDQFTTNSHMASTAGQVNLNSKIYPENRWFNPPERRKPLEGVFVNLKSTESDASLNRLLEGISDFQKPKKVFEYIGQLSEVGGYRNGRTEFERDEILRNMAGCLTTQSNTFGLWGVAQSIKKGKFAEQPDQFEKGDAVLGEKRFFAVIERYVWPGKDGVPGNAHVNAKGVWDRTARQSGKIRPSSRVTTLVLLPGSPPQKSESRDSFGEAGVFLDRDGRYPEYDGPTQVGMDRFTQATLGGARWRTSSLEDAYNPPQPVMKYRVVYFKYLED